jgi:hypothetical protein
LSTQNGPASGGSSGSTRTAGTGRKNLIERPGACQLTLWHRSGTGWELRSFRFDIPSYNGPGALAWGGNPAEIAANAAAIAARTGQMAGDVRAIAQAGLAAGADRVVWMLYYDITPARVDVDELIEATDTQPFTLILGLLGAMPEFDLHPLVDVAVWPNARKYTAALNALIVDSLPANARVTTVKTTPVIGRGEIQTTSVYGSPHPNAVGHANLMGELKKVLG